MYVFISILILIIALLLILIVLVQNSKGGGLASGFSSSNQIMGVRKTTDFLEKATWTLSTLLIGLCILAAAFVPRSHANVESEMKQQINSTAAPSTALPNFGTSDGTQPEAQQSTDSSADSSTNN